MRLSIFLSVLLICLIAEYFWPLRVVRHNKSRRVFINLSIGAVSFVVMRWLFSPLVLLAAVFAKEQAFGFLPYSNFHPVVVWIIAILALDYTLYWWHVMNHHIPFLWRFHLVHHVDLDLDVSTASRFHVGELILSAAYRVGQIVILGIDPLQLLVFETLITTAAQFHHSNIRLPLRLEKVLNLVIVTPRMHGVHHSVREKELNSNFSTIFSFWDRLHKSMRLNRSPSQITVGVSGYLNQNQQTLAKSLILPFANLFKKS